MFGLMKALPSPGRRGGEWNQHSCQMQAVVCKTTQIRVDFTALTSVSQEKLRGRTQNTDFASKYQSVSFSFLLAAPVCQSSLKHPSKKSCLLHTLPVV